MNTAEKRVCVDPTFEQRRLRALPYPEPEPERAKDKSAKTSDDFDYGTSLGDLAMPDPLDGQTILGDPAGNRWLEIGGIAMLVGMSGIGKSTILLQMLILWALGREAFGIKPARPLRTILIQVENSNGKIAQFREGIYNGLKLSKEERNIVNRNIIVKRETECFGFDLVKDVLEPMCEKWKPDFIAGDPTTQLYGDNMNDNKLVAAWMTRGLMTLANKHNCAVFLNHHTNKPQQASAWDEETAVSARYAGAGAAAFTNVPRANLFIRDIGCHDAFLLCAEKNGADIGWRNEDGTIRRSRYIAYGEDGGGEDGKNIFWRGISDEEGDAMRDEAKDSGGEDKSKKQKEYTATMLEILKDSDGLHHGEWLKAGKGEGVTISGGKRAIDYLRDKSNQVENPGGIYRVKPITKHVRVSGEKAA